MSPMSSVQSPPTIPAILFSTSICGNCKISNSLRWIGYLSTTGVYGDRDGDWVDENSPRKPTCDRSRRAPRPRILADLWQRDGLPVHVFRLAGIYGPGRSAIDSVRGGTAKRVAKPGQVFSRSMSTISPRC